MRAAQFGLTLFTYEVVQRLIYVDFGGSRFFLIILVEWVFYAFQTKRITDGDNHRGCQFEAIKVGFQSTLVATFSLRVNDHIGGYAVAAPIFAGIESKFGLRFPKFRESVI